MLIAALLFQAAPAPAACASTDAALPPALAGWTTRASALAPGRATVLDAVDPRAALLRDVAPPGRPGKIAITGFTIARAGTYGLALDQRAWIDVYPATGAKALASSAHGHGPACSTIAKIVRFRLSPGRYRVLVSGIERPAAKLMLVAGEGDQRP